MSLYHQRKEKCHLSPVSPGSVCTEPPVHQSLAGTEEHKMVLLCWVMTYVTDFIYLSAEGHLWETDLRNKVTFNNAIIKCRSYKEGINVVTGKLDFLFL